MSLSYQVLLALLNTQVFNMHEHLSKFLSKDPLALGGQLPYRTGLACEPNLGLVWVLRLGSVSYDNN